MRVAFVIDNLGLVNAFADRLVELPLVSWCTIGQSISDDHDGLPVRRYACNALDTALADHLLGLSRWYARDVVETAAYYASGGVRGWSREQRLAFAAARCGAETAALALLARNHLSEMAFDALCAPFERYLLH